MFLLTDNLDRSGSLCLSQGIPSDTGIGTPVLRVHLKEIQGYIVKIVDGTELVSGLQRHSIEQPFNSHLKCKA